MDDVSERTGTPLAAPTLLRASSLRSCPRKAVYEATDAPARERYASEERILWRGKSIGRDYVIFLATTNQWRVYVESGPDWWLPPELRADTAEAADVIAERKIRWAHGTGHADLYVKETRTIVEVLSSAHASDEMRRSKLLQAILYVEHDPDAVNAALVVLNPSDFTEERTVVMPTSRMYTGLVAEMQARVAQVDGWKNTGDLPARVCGKPTEARGHFCLYAGHCFTGYEPEPLPALDGEDVTQYVIRLAHAKAKRSELSSADKVLEEEQKEIQAKLAEIVPAGKWHVNGYDVGRSPRTKRTFDVTRANLDSRFDPDLLDEFTKVSSFDVWSVEKTAAATVQSEAGDVPF